MGFYPKNEVSDADYLMQRVESEIALADRAKDEHASEIHRTLASAYAGRLFGEDGSDGVPGWRRRTDFRNVAAVFSKFGATLERTMVSAPADDLLGLLQKLDAEGEEDERPGL